MTRPVVWTSRHDSHAPSRWYASAYYDWDRDKMVWAWLGLHLVLRAWHWWSLRRWALERFGVRWGCFDLEEGGYFKDGHWTLNVRRVWERRIADVRHRSYAAEKRAYDEGVRDGGERARARTPQ